MTKNFNNNRDTYPIVLLPKTVLKNIHYGIDELRIKSELNIKKPEKQRTYYPNKPSKIREIEYERVKFGDLGCLIHTLIFCLLFSLVFVVFGLMPFFDAFGFTFCIVGLFIIITLGILSGNPLLPKATKAKKKIEISDEEYRKLLRVYEIDVAEHLSKKIRIENSYKLQLEEYNTFLKTNHKKISQKIHFSDLKPIRLAKRVSKPPKRGVSEIKFLEIASKKLRNQIFIDISTTNNFYCPDMTIICPKTNLHIDIEIDEPYTLLDRTPIHYFNCGDEERNEHFLTNNWCIIRFCEEQIFTQPNECVKTIQSVIDSIKKMKKSYSTEVNEIKSWSYEESIVMASNNYRNKYK